jgi:DNA-binding NarL/FixJ family response regulator
LIVDDHAPFRDSARRLLDAEGFAVVGEAEDGADALRLVEELRPEIVLLDVQLPDFDGFEVARRLSELDPRPEVILISSREDYRALVGSSEARAFLRKDELSGETLAAALG